MNKNTSELGLYVLLPVLVVLILAPFSTTLDLAIAHYYYDQTGHFTSNRFFNFIYNYGVMPAQATAIIAFIIFCLTYILSALKKFRTPSLVLVLTMVLGAGFITHTLLKDHWGRPRPKQVIEFGGKQEFRPFYDPNFFHQPEPSKSFPCGHCSMGFFFFALALVLKRAGYNILFYVTMVFALALGIALGMARMAQGGHFLTDIIMSALIMWLTAYLCNRYLNAD